MQLSASASILPLSPVVPARIRKAATVAMTRVAWDVREGLMQGMQSSFDRPNPWTMRAWRVAPAGLTADGNIEAVVYAAPSQARYLFWQVEGGERNTKGFERRMNLFGGEVAIPTRNAKLDQYGNVNLSTIKRMSSDKDKRFFVGRPKGGDRPEGVWLRSRHRLYMVMAFEDSASYKPRLDVPGISQGVVSRSFRSQILRALSA